MAIAIVVLLALGFGLAPASASAVVYSGSTTFPAPTGNPSLNGPAPDPAQTAEYLHTLSASYDDQSGSVTISFGLYDPGTWGPVLTSGDGGSGSGGQLVSPPIEFELGDVTPGVSCNPNGGVPGIDGPPLGSPVLSSSVDSTYNDNDGSFAGDTIGATLEGYSGQVSAPVSFDGTTFTATVQNPNFQGHIWDCLVLDQSFELQLSPPPPPPTPPTLLNPWASKFSVRPRLIGLSGDGSNFLAGARQHGRQSSSNPGWSGHIVWSSWTMTQALGTGGNWIDNCKPNCAGGTYYVHPAKLRAYDPQNGRFTRLWLRIRYHGRWHTYISKLVYSHSFWYWGLT
jgi:hypothetical protein